MDEDRYPQGWWSFSAFMLGLVLFLALAYWADVSSDRARVETRRRIAVQDDLNMCEAERDLMIGRVDELVSERDRIKAELKAAAEALDREAASESVELRLFRDKLVEVEKRLTKAKEDRDNLANELAAEKQDRDRLAEGFVAVEREAAGLRVANEALKVHLGECRAELAKGPKCPCECEWAPVPVEPKPSRKKRHRK